MEATPGQSRIVSFGLFEADLEKGELRKSGVRVKLHDQPFQILTLLLERAGEIITREEIRQRLWPGNTFVEFDNGLNVAIKKLRTALCDDADSPRFVETVPRRGYRFIAPIAVTSGVVTTPASTDNISTGVAVPALPAVPERGKELPGSRGYTRRLELAVALMMVLIALAGIAAYRWRASPAIRAAAKSNAVSRIAPRRSVAVLGFRNASAREDAAWLSTALPEMLSSELAAGDRLRMVPGEDVAHLNLTSSAPGADSLSKETARHLHEVLATQLLVSGSYTVLGGHGARQLRLDVRLQNASTGEILTEVAENGEEANVFHLVSRVGERLRQSLGVPGVSGKEQAQVLASAPSNPEAVRFYALGLSKLREFDALTARDLLQQAVAADPDYPLSHSALAAAWKALGYDPQARAEAKKAYDLSSSLLPTDRLLVEGQFRETTADWSKAVSVYRTLFALFPDNIEFGLRLANAQRLTAPPSAAEETIAALRRLPAPASQDPRIDLAEEMLFGGTDRDRALKLVQDAGAKAKLLGAKLIYAQARLNECIDLTWGVHPQAALAACEEARQIFLAAGDRRHAAIALRTIADRYSDEGHNAEALPVYQEALAILGQIGDMGNTAAVLNNMGTVLESQGDLDRSQTMFAEAAQAFKDTGESDNYVIAASNVADIRAMKGDLRGAARTREQILAVARATTNNGAIAMPLIGLATSRWIAGDLKEAHALAEEAVQMGRKVGDPLPLTSALLVMGDVRRAEGDLTGARRDYEEATTLRQKLGDAGAVAEVRLNLANISLDEGNPAQAQMLLQQAIAEFTSEKAKINIALAGISLARALLIQGKLDEAKRAAGEAISASKGNTDPTITIPLAILQARVVAAEAVSAHAHQVALQLARKQLQKAGADARRIGLYDGECQARLALGEVEMEINSVLGRSTLASLEQSSNSHGFRLVAHQAAALRESGTLVRSTLASAGKN